MHTVEPLEKHGDAFADRCRYWRRALARGVGRSPPALLRQAIRRAAVLEAEAERVLADPTATANDKVRIGRLARHARRDLKEAVATMRQSAHKPSDAELMAMVE